MSRLPVDYDRLEHDRIEYSAREWDQTPRVSTTREIERLMPAISRLAANEITASADMNDLRCFMFNLMAEREFENKDFDNLCQFLADFTELRTEERNLNDAARGLEESIVHGVRFYCAGLMDKFPELRRVVDNDRNPQNARSWDINLGQYREILEVIEDMHNEDQSDLRSRGNSRAYDRNDRDDRRYERDSDRGRRSGRDRGRERDRDRDRNGRVDSRGNYNVRSSTDSDSRDYSRDRNRERVRDRNDDRRRDYDDERVNRSRSENPAFDPSDFATEQRPHNDDESRYAVEEIISQHRLKPDPELQVQTQPDFDDETMIMTEFGPIKRLIPKGKSEMDIFAHSSIYGKDTQAARDFAQEVKRVLTASQAVKETNITAENISQEDVIVETGIEMFATVSAMCDGISNSSTATMVANAGENKDGRRQIFHKAAVVSNAFIGYPHLSDFHARLQERTTFTEVVDFMRRSLAAVDLNASGDAAYASDIRAAVEYYDSFFANEVSTYCQNVLRLRGADPTKPLITSVINGYDELINYLSESGQDNLRSALAGMLTSLMLNLTHNWEEVSGIKTGILSDVESLTPSEETTLGVTYLPVGYFVTHLPFTMKELGYNITEPTAINDSDTSDFLKAALDISGTDLIDETINPSPFRIMMTRDRKVFRIYRFPGNGRTMILVPIHVN